VLPRAELNSFSAAHLRFLARFFLEMVNLMEMDSVAIRRRLFGRLRLQIDALREAARVGRGVLAPTIQTNVPFRFFFCGLPAGTPVNVLLHRQHPGVQDILAKADPGWNFLFLEDSPGREARRALESGQIVVCNIDHAYPGTEVTLGPVFERPAIIPSGIFSLAALQGSPVVPLTITEDRDAVSIAATRIFHWEDVSAPLPVARMLERIGATFDSAILSCPPEWLGWGNLERRWTVWKRYLDAA
jgi:hypothetical protein